MRTVKEIAMDLNVTIQTIYNHIKKNEKELKGNIAKIQGITYLDDEGIRIIKESMGLIQPPLTKQDIGIEEIIENISKQVTDRIREEIRKEMQEELEKQEKRIIEEVTQKHLEQIQAENNKLIDYIAATREQEKKKGFFNRLFGK